MVSNGTILQTRERETRLTKYVDMAGKALRIE